MAADQRWEWSDEVAALHGYPPGTTTPTTELLSSHEHPGDRATIAETLAAAVRHEQPLCSRHRIIDTAGTVHDVLVVGDRIHDSTGARAGITGYHIDLTPQLTHIRRETLDGAPPEVVAARSLIDQADRT